MEEIKVFNESPSIYRQYIDSFINQDRLLPKYDWMVRVADGIDPLVIYRDTSFALVPDITWDMKSIDDLHVLAIVQDNTIRSVRDLRREHLPLLRRIRSVGRLIISRQYGIPIHMIEASVHYHPSYYWLHIHFTPVGINLRPGRSIFLDDIIANISIYPNYYQESTLRLYIYPHMPLYSYIH